MGNFVDTCFQPHRGGGLCRYSCDRWWINTHGIIVGRCWNHIPTSSELTSWKELTKKEVAVYRVMDS